MYTTEYKNFKITEVFYVEMKDTHHFNKDTLFLGSRSCHLTINPKLILWYNSLDIKES